MFFCLTAIYQVQVGQKFADQLKVADYHSAAFGSQKRAFDQSTPPDISVKPTDFAST
jgi:hypothetical protein